VIFAYGGVEAVKTEEVTSLRERERKIKRVKGREKEREQFLENQIEDVLFRFVLSISATIIHNGNLRPYIRKPPAPQ
jgi:hypothetical protein